MVLLSKIVFISLFDIGGMGLQFMQSTPHVLPRIVVSILS
jgi:hypothetical protein